MNELLELGIIILLFYIPIYGLVNRICMAFERCHGVKIDEK